ncbi:MAG: hypothetical protein E7206_17905 [Clostridium beijerinckii]|nr:hypothetical protein [Clostridium beijerinckii]
MVFKFLKTLKSEVGEINFKRILSMADQDIKFNRVRFGKRTSPGKYTEIVQICKVVALKKI